MEPQLPGGSALTRRAFTQQALGSLLTFSLLETLVRHDLLAAEIKPLTARWVNDLNQLGLDLKGEKIDQPQWQQKIEELLKQVDLADLLSFIDFERIAVGASLAERGERSIRFSFPKVEGVPSEVCFGKQIFALKKDRSVVPHGHNNMATAFIILKGDLRGRHYDRVKDEDGFMLIKPTIDRKFTPGEYSTVSDYRDNVHWFTALTEPAYIFNLHLLDVIKPGNKLQTGRVYVDPEGEKIEGGLTRAKLINYDQAHQMYG
jgi:hypothetical protein